MPSKPHTFWQVMDRHVVVRPDTGCWVWVGARDKKGYGQKSQQRAHRWFYLLEGDNVMRKRSCRACKQDRERTPRGTRECRVCRRDADRKRRRKLSS